MTIVQGFYLLLDCKQFLVLIKFLYLNYDHEYLRIYFEDFCKIVSDFENDRVPMHVSIRKLIATGKLIVHNLLQHILAEDTVYFEVAESGFSEFELEEMGKEMKNLESRLKEEYQPITIRK